MTRLLPLLLLSACAGDPFTLQLSDSGPALAITGPSPSDAHIDAPSGAPADASTDAPGDARPEATQEPAPEASTIDAGAPEESQLPPVDAGYPDALWRLPDAGPDSPYVLPDACTPFPSPITWNASCDGVMATVPSDYFTILGNQGCGGQPMGAELAQATPKPCQCVETYSCACLDLYGVCPGKHPTSCAPSPNENTEIVVNCN